MTDRTGASASSRGQFNFHICIDLVNCYSNVPAPAPATLIVFKYKLLSTSWSAPEDADDAANRILSRELREYLKIHFFTQLYICNGCVKVHI